MDLKQTSVLFCSDDLTSSFLITDLIFFSKHFSKVTLITGTKINLDLPPNVQVFFIDSAGYNTFSTIKKNVINFLRTAVAEIVSTPRYLFFPKIFIRELSGLLRSYYKADVLQSYLESGGERAFMPFTFWFNEWATTLAILKDRKKIDCFFSRAHGIDLFEERSPVIKKIPFRRFQMKHISGVFSVSKKGADYLKKKYPSTTNRIFTSYLGSAEPGINPFDDKQIFTIVSCAQIRDIKRIHLIPDILRATGISLRWVHIGGKNTGDPSLDLLDKNLEYLKQHCRQIEVLFAGDLSHKEVLEFYATTPVNLFISVSETEGLPVSMMEAISFGIPVMATDVGGCGEIVNERTGILIDKNFDFQEAAKKIVEFRNSKMNTSEFRQGARFFWESNFDAKANFESFIALINNIKTV